MALGFSGEGAVFSREAVGSHRRPLREGCWQSLRKINSPEFGLKKGWCAGQPWLLVPEKLPTQGARRQGDRTAAPEVKVLLTFPGREGAGEGRGEGVGVGGAGEGTEVPRLNKESETGGGRETGPRRCASCLHFLPSVSFLALRRGSSGRPEPEGNRAGTLESP